MEKSSATAVIGLLATGKKRNALERFSRRPRHDLDAAFKDITFVDEHQVRFASRISREHRPEVLADFLNVS